MMLLELIPICGDGICAGGETSSNCPGDCVSTSCTTTDPSDLAVTSLSVSPTTIYVDETQPTFTTRIKNNGDCDYAGSPTGHGLDIFWVGEQRIIDSHIPEVGAGQTNPFEIDFTGTFGITDDPLDGQSTKIPRIDAQSTSIQFEKKYRAQHR